MCEESIIAGIEAAVDRLGSYKMWIIGITDDPMLRYSERYSSRSWHCWDAGTEIAAETIMGRFVGKGMHEDVGVAENARYVYIY